MEVGRDSTATHHGCTLKPVDPKFETLDAYDFGYIERTVYDLADSDDMLAPHVKEALGVIEQAYHRFG